MEENIISSIKEFISIIKNHFQIDFYYEYNQEENVYYLYHNYINFNENQFENIMGEYISKLFFDMDIYNICITYRGGYLVNKEQLKAEILADIKKQKEIYNNENSTLEQQERAYKKKQELFKELKELENKDLQEQMFS